MQKFQAEIAKLCGWRYEESEGCWLDLNNANRKCYNVVITRYEIFPAIERDEKWRDFYSMLIRLLREQVQAKFAGLESDEIPEDEWQFEFDFAFIRLTDALIIEACARVYGWGEEEE
jgi:hypothetical protein